MPDLSSLLQRLKERKLVQWGLAYLAGAFVVLQAVEVMAEPWAISPTLQRAVHVVLVFGLLITLVLAWYHGEKGRQRVSGPELLMVAALLVVAGVALTFLPGGREGPVATEETPSATPDDQRPSIAVLPFQNRSGLEEDAHFTDGLHDQILTQLGKIRGLSVRSLTSVLVYRDSPKNLKGMGEELNARYIMEGGVQRAGGTVRINVQLIEAATDEHIWASVYDRVMSVENLLSIQSEIVESITDSLRAVVTPEELARLEDSPTQNNEAYDAFLLGRSYLRRQVAEEDFRKAIQFFEIALDADSLFAPAHSSLGEAYADLAMGNIDPPDQTWPLAREAAMRALQIDENLTAAHRVMALEKIFYEWDWEGAESEFLRSLEINPDQADTRLYFSWLLGVLHRSDEGLIHLREARRLEPNSPWVNLHSCWALILLDRLIEAEELAESLIRSEPPIPLGNLCLAQTLLEQGRLEAALAPLHSATISMGEDIADETAWLSMTYGLLGREEEARRYADQLEELAGRGRLVSPVNRAWVSIGLGDIDRAIGLFEEGFGERDPYMFFLSKMRFLAPGIGDDPRFQALREKMGLE